MSFLRHTTFGSPRGQTADLRDLRILLSCQDKSKDFYLNAEKARNQSHADGDDQDMRKAHREQDLDKSNELFFAAIQAMTLGVPTEEWAPSDFLRVMNCYIAIVHNCMNSYRDNAYSQAAKFCHFAMMFYRDHTVEALVNQAYHFCFAEINWMYADYAAHYYKKDNGRLTSAFEDVLLEYLSRAVDALEKSHFLYEHNDGELRKVSVLYSEISKVYDFIGFHLAALRHMVKAIKVRATINEIYKTSEDYYMLAALCRDASSLSKFDPAYHALFDFMGKYFAGNKVINYLYLKSILSMCMENLDEKSHDQIYLLAHFIRLIFSSSKSKHLPESNLRTELRESEIEAQLNSMLEPLFTRELEIFEEDTDACSDYLAKQTVTDEAPVSTFRK